MRDFSQVACISSAVPSVVSCDASEVNVPGDANEQGPWGRFYLEHRRALIAYAAALTGSVDEGMDVIQDVLTRLVAQHADPASPRAFVFRCLRNCAADRARLRRRQGPEASDAALAFLASPSPDRRDTAAESTERLRAALAHLDDRRREVIVLKVYGELTFNEIATVLGCPIGTAASHYARGIDELRSRIEEEYRNEYRADRAVSCGDARRNAGSGA